MFWLRKNKVSITPNEIQQHLVYQSYINKSDKCDIEKLFARLFSTEDGKKVLAYLQQMTFFRAANPSLSEPDLRHIEGQRALLATILKLTDLGRS